MTVHLTQELIEDADHLEREWGVRVALEMLHDGLLSPTDFLWLCEESADASDRTDD
jgi:hypothetical protein